MAQSIIFFAIGLFLGGVIMFIISRVSRLEKYVSKSDYDKLITEIGELKIELAKSATPEILAQSYVGRDLYNLLEGKLKQAEDLITEKGNEILELNLKMKDVSKDKEHVNEKLEVFNKELEGLHQRTQEQFRNLATTILDEKGQSFIKTNKTELFNILDPLKNDLSVFKKSIEDTRKEDIQDLTSLKKEIETLRNMNNQLSEDAQQLAQALKGDSKIQGDWGEDRLRLIIENEGLVKYLDFESQKSLHDDDDRNKRTDFIINLPNGKHIIIDSKVSLTDYVNYFNSTDPEEKKKYLKKHIESVIRHIETLSGKDYQSLLGLKSVDYVFMFMPIEQALTIALNEDPKIFNKALERKVVLITPLTIVSTLKIVKILWQAENRVNNVEKIFIEFGKLYDKFAGFMKDLKNVGDALEDASRAHHDAMYKLVEGKKKGDTIIGRFETIKNLEARTKAQIPQQYLDEIGYMENDDEVKKIEERTGQEDTE